jgi:hypothetical protein
VPLRGDFAHGGPHLDAKPSLFAEFQEAGSRFAPVAASTAKRAAVMPVNTLPVNYVN